MFLYLWKERSRPPFGSRAWLKSWAKRVYNADALLSICWRRYRLQKAGARIGNLTVIVAKLNGPKTNLVIGEGCAIGNATFALHAPITIGDNVSIVDNVTVLTASHDLADPEWKMFRREIKIDDYAWIAQGATLLPGIHIGRGAVVGANAVVTRDVEPYTVVAGNPAQPTGRKRIENLSYRPSAFMAAFEAWLGAPTRPQNW